MTQNNSVDPVNEYINLLKLVDQSTDQLNLAIREWDAESVTSLIDYRGQLVSQVGNARKSAWAVLDSSIGTKSAIDATEKLERLIMSKQLACEAVLSDALDECKNSLISINQHNGLRHTYTQPTAGSHARFLDSSQ